jgi:hypothetical protein
MEQTARRRVALIIMQNFHGRLKNFETELYFRV